MQLWIFFTPGTGGDGIANLLEHSRNVTTIDHGACIHATPIQQFWRVDRFIDHRPKFWAPARFGVPFNKHCDRILDSYVNIVNSGAVTIVTSHDCTLQFLDCNNFSNAFTKHQIRVLLQSTCPTTTRKNFLEKNLIPYNKKTILTSKNKPNIDYSNFDHVIDVDDLTFSWANVEKFTNLVGLDLDKQHYDNFCFINSGKENSLLYSDTTPRYKSVVNIDDWVSYEKL